MKLHKNELKAGRTQLDLYVEVKNLENYGDGGNLKQYLIMAVGDDIAMTSSWEGLRLFMKDYLVDLMMLIQTVGLEKFMLFLISLTNLRRPITDHELWESLDSQLNGVPRSDLAPKLTNYGLQWFSTDFQNLNKHEWHFATGEHRSTQFVPEDAEKYL